MNVMQAMLQVAENEGFAGMLREWRQRRRLSQLALAVEAMVSQRHISFLESGRAMPSREMILRICDTLDVPLRERNAMLRAGGFAPVFAARPLEHPQMQQVMRAVEMMLRNHEPYPAVALDRAWNIRQANGAFQRIAGVFGEDLWERIGGQRPNLLRAFFHPAGMRPYVTNWGAIAPVLWCRAKREAEETGGVELRELLREMIAHQDAGVLQVSEGTALLPVLPVTVERDGVRLSLFTVIATFGTAQDVTTDELRIETLFPADEETERVLRGVIKGFGDFL
jgi:transcriptional regulator with XRE-family HTH domain